MRPNEMSATEAAAAIRAGQLSSAELVQACLARIAARESEVGAWEYLDPERAMAEARKCDARPPRGPLHGIPIAVKDIIDTADMPTRYGSSIYQGQRPAWDAACVVLARRAGAIILGKTVSTEFAYFSPGKTANPKNLAHTPGGSSSGSAAAVADMMVPVAFGTQTAASVIRPASYCGVIGYKPSYGTFSLAGIKAFSPSFDTLGTLTRNVDDAALMYQVLLDVGLPDLRKPDKLRVGLCRTPWWHLAEPATKTAVESAARCLSENGAHVEEVLLPQSFDRLAETHKLIMAYEASRSLAFEYDARRSDLSASMLHLIEMGMSVPRAEYSHACAELRTAQDQVRTVFADLDVLLTPSAPGEAPPGLAATGDPLFSRMWTLLHLPSLTLPGLVGPNELPVGVQMVGALGGDERLLQVAKWAERIIGAQKGSK